MVEIRDFEGLVDWLKPRPAIWSSIIATRAIWRALPALGCAFEEISSTNDWRNGALLTPFRALIVAGSRSRKSASIIPNRNIKVIYNPIRLLRRQYTQNRSVEDLGNSLLYFLNSALTDQPYINASLAIDWSATTIVQAIREQNDKQLLAVQSDTLSLESGLDLWSQPLWLDDTPEWAVRGWEVLATELTRHAPHWKTLVRWYEDRLHGDDWAAAQGRPAIPELEIARASLPDSYWKKGGKAVNEAIAALEAFFWEDKPLQDPVLRDLVEQAGVIRDEPAGDIEAVDEPPVEVLPLPTLPAQSHGPHFGLRGGLLDFAPPDHLDAGKNNIQRLKSLHPLLQSEAQSAIDVFGRNLAHGRIHNALRTYAGLLDGDVTTLNYDLIAGVGVKLQSEEAAAQEAIADGLEPAFERSETAALKTLLDLHGPFILATEGGQTFVADAERWERNPRQEKRLRQSATKLAEAIEADGIATPATLDFVKAAAADIGLGPQPERSAVFGIGAVRNVSIALIGSAAIYVGANAVMSWDMTHWLSVILITESIKKSDAGIGVTGLLTDAINDVTRGKALRRIYEFALKHEATLCQLASRRREFSFLIEWLDWLKAKPKE